MAASAAWAPSPTQTAFNETPMAQGQTSQQHDPPKSPSAQTHSIYIPGVQRSIGQALSESHAGEESPVMNETLSVIEEHIDDLRTPRQSLASPHHLQGDSESDYSREMDRASYIAGPETDDEDTRAFTEAEVRSWDYKQTAAHLRDIGVDSKHCDIFEDQEISGDVLLEMDQSFIYMKEYDFGVMGRRMKTWHKIRDFQNEVCGSRNSTRQSTIPGMNQDNSVEDLTRSQSRALAGGSILPRIPSLMEKPGLSLRQSHIPSSADVSAGIPQPLQPQALNSFARASINTSTPPSPWRASVLESPSRPSAALVRELSHSRRHSSIDFGEKPNLDLAASSLGKITPHKKQPSFDQTWSLTSATPASTNTTAPSPRLSTLHKEESQDFSASRSLRVDTSTLDLDRGYFSGNELDNRKARNVLRKRDSGGSPIHSRQASQTEEPKKVTAAMKRHSRLSSVDSTREIRPTLGTSAAQAYHSRSYKGRFRSASARTSNVHPPPAGLSPTVTNLEENSPSIGTVPSRVTHKSERGKKFLGLRITSDAVTHSEKAQAAAPAVVDESLKNSPIMSPTGSTTPSATSRSFEVDNTDTSSKGTEAMANFLAVKTTERPAPRTKRQTSAYTRGLLKISPEDAKKNCDHYGWMKKKSSGLITTWKLRLFILRGRRLSYYYSESDKEERGIIDISGHKVLAANSESMTTLHAQITGAASSPSPGIGASASDSALRDAANSPFYFKLVPPKAGISRAVQFTKPTIHYFQCDNLAQGRKWMGEILKATIEHDLGSFETTNKQKTISLSKARERRERPPALKGTEDIIAEAPSGPLEEKTGPESGLNIQGLGFHEDSGISFELPAVRTPDEVPDAAPAPVIADTGRLSVAQS